MPAPEWLAPVPLPRLPGGFRRSQAGHFFAFHKLPLRGYLAAIAIFCNEVKGKSALAISRDLGLSYKAAFVLLHKLREAMAEEMKGRKLGGDGIVAEVDGGYFGGYVKPANRRENRRDRRLARNQTGKRKAVVVIRERNRRSLPAVFRTEGHALSFIRSRIVKGTIVNADESGLGLGPSFNRIGLGSWSPNTFKRKIRRSLRDRAS